jgi:protease-4
MMNYFKRMLKFSLKVGLGTAIVASVLTVSGILFALFITTFFSMFGMQSRNANFTREIIYGKEDAKHQFISIPITGIILGDRSDIGDPFGVFEQTLTYGYEIKATLRDLAEDTRVDGVILEINSPGGTIYGAKAIADGVLYYKEKTGKPVISFVSGLAASGAYWSAVSADKIFADQGTSVGSIGVIFGPFEYYDKVLAKDSGILLGGVVTQNGIESLFITAGKSKDFGNPFRRLTAEEISRMQSMVNNEYDMFVDYVASRRSIPKKTIIEDIGALVYDGKSGKEKNLIDMISNKDDAYKALAKLANVPEDDFSVSQEYPKKGLLMTILESRRMTTPLRSSASLCGLTKVVLAYHGNVSKLCQ